MLIMLYSIHKVLTRLQGSGCRGLGRICTFSCSRSFEALSFSLLLGLPCFDMVSALPAYKINNRTHGCHYHNIHSFQGIIHRMYTNDKTDFKIPFTPRKAMPHRHVLGSCLGDTGFLYCGPDHVLREMIMPSMPGLF